MEFRNFKESDAEEVSSLIRRSIMNRNNKGYKLSELYSICNYYSADNLRSGINEKHTVVCVDKGKIIGTMTLKADEVKTLFIDPKYQGNGLGTKLMDLLEKEAKDKALSKIWGVAALSAVDFYKARGYVVVGEKLHPEWGKGIIIEKSL